MLLKSHEHFANRVIDTYKYYYSKANKRCMADKFLSYNGKGWYNLGGKHYRVSFIMQCINRLKVRAEIN